MDGGVYNNSSFSAKESQVILKINKADKNT